MADNDGNSPLFGDSKSIDSVADATSNATKATDKATKSTGDLSDNVNVLGRRIGETTDNLKKFGAEMKGAEEKAKTYTEWLKEQDAQLKQNIQSLKENAWGLTTLHGAYGAVIGAAGQFLGKIKDLINPIKALERQIKQIEYAQRDYTSSLNFSSDSLGKASKEHQKYLNATAELHKSAAGMAYKLGMIEEGAAEKVVATGMALQNKFRTQFGMYKQQGKLLTEMTQTTLIFSKVMGIDAAEATEYMADRLAGSTKTLDEMHTEVKAVNNAIDDYKKGLYTLGEAARKTAQIETDQLLKSLKSVSQTMKVGILDAENYVRMLAQIAIESKRMGVVTNKEIGELHSMLGKFATTGGGDLESLWAIRAAQNLLAKGPGQIADKQLAGRLGFVKGKYETDSPLALKAAMGAARGSQEYMRLQLEEIRKLPRDIARQEIQRLAGGEEYTAAIFQDMLEKGKLTELTQEVLKKSGENKETLDKKFDKFTEAFKQAQRPDDPKWRALFEAKRSLDYILNILKWGFGAILVALVAQAAGSIISRMVTGAAGIGAAGALGVGAAGAGAGGAAALAARRGAAGGAARTFTTRSGRTVTLRGSRLGPGAARGAPQAAAALGKFGRAGRFLGRFGAPLAIGAMVAGAGYSMYQMGKTPSMPAGSAAEAATAGPEAAGAGAAPPAAIDRIHAVEAEEDKLAIQAERRGMLEAHKEMREINKQAKKDMVVDTAANIAGMVAMPLAAALPAMIVGGTISHFQEKWVDKMIKKHYSDMGEKGFQARQLASMRELSPNMGFLSSLGWGTKTAAGVQNIAAGFGHQASKDLQASYADPHFWGKGERGRMIKYQSWINRAEGTWLVINNALEGHKKGIEDVKKMTDKERETYLSTLKTLEEKKKLAEENIKQVKKFEQRGIGETKEKFMKEAKKAVMAEMKESGADLNTPEGKAEFAKRVLKRLPRTMTGGMQGRLSHDWFNELLGQEDVRKVGEGKLGAAGYKQLGATMMGTSYAQMARSRLEMKGVVSKGESLDMNDEEILQKWDEFVKGGGASAEDIGISQYTDIEALKKSVSPEQQMQMQISAPTADGGTQTAAIDNINNAFKFKIPGQEISVGFEKLAPAMVNAGSPAPSTRTV